MRVERLATTSFAEVTRARQLIHAALARALDQIDADMTGRSALYPADNPYVLGEGDGRIGTNFLDGSVKLFVPRAEYSEPNFIRLNDVTNAEGRVIGRVGFYAVNCSGLLDVNIIGAKARGQGRGGDEIPLSPSLLTNDHSDSTDLLERRSKKWKRI